MTGKSWKPSAHLDPTSSFFSCLLDRAFGLLSISFIHWLHLFSLLKRFLFLRVQSQASSPLDGLFLRDLVLYQSFTCCLKFMLLLFYSPSELLWQNPPETQETQHTPIRTQYSPPPDLLLPSLGGGTSFKMGEVPSNTFVATPKVQVSTSAEQAIRTDHPGAPWLLMAFSSAKHTLPQSSLIITVRVLPLNVIVFSLWVTCSKNPL